MTPVPDRVQGWGDPDAAGDGLHAWLRSPTGDEIATGAGSAVFVHGAVAHERLAVRSVALTVDGAPVASTAALMPSPGLAAERPDLRDAGRAIFWGIVPLAAGSSAVELGLRVRPSAGSAIDLPISRLSRATSPAAGAGTGAGAATVAICMATYEPTRELLERQLESLRAQTHADWICVISDDASERGRGRRIERARRRATRGSSSRAPERRAAPTRTSTGRWRWRRRGAGYVALCDQDDRWHPDKLETLIAALGDGTASCSATCG